MAGLFSINSDETDMYKKYDKKTLIPQYKPSCVKPNIDSLVNIKKYGKLVRDIKKSSISEEEKRFLLFAASRHIVFNYSLIADYYANSNMEMQKLMEQSALVIIDINDAIAYGYVKLSKNIEKIMSESGKPVKDDEL